jgi:hypothetical protein
MDGRHCDSKRKFLKRTHWAIAYSHPLPRKFQFSIEVCHVRTSLHNLIEESPLSFFSVFLEGGGGFWGAAWAFASYWFWMSFFEWLPLVLIVLAFTL